MENMQIHFNYLAILVTTILGFVVGGLWYGPLFGKVWMKELGLTEDSLKNSPMLKIFGLTIILNIIIALNLSAFLGPKPDLLFGLLAGLAVGIGWVSTSLGIIYLFGRKSLKLYLIDASYQIIIYACMGSIIGVWK
jgi:hypothetical protein